ncbi:MAG: polysaccharide pyruvyl transferase family protein [Sedimenticola sp.]
MYGGLLYEKSNNFGDEIQSLAAEQHLPPVTQYFERDSLRSAIAKEPHIVILNGWFSWHPEQTFPAGQDINPIFFGFHITDWNASSNYFLSADCINYFKQHQPIGCRDETTANVLRGRGVDAFCSHCLTLTFPRRSAPPTDGRIFIVDAKHIPIPGSLRKRATRLSHGMKAIYGAATKREAAREVLSLYRNQAHLVITTRLHCALPCVAMGIPVIFFGDPDDHRVSILKDIGVPVYPEPPRLLKSLYRLAAKYFPGFYMRGINWDPEPVDFEGEKAKMLTRLHDMLKQTEQRISQMREHAD